MNRSQVAYPHPDMSESPSSSVTDWSMIVAASDGDESAWDRLARQYWPAIYAYIRSSGRSVSEASDLTQGFLCDVVLGRNLLDAADPSRGRFRTLLLTALKNYLVERHRHATRQRRQPQGGRTVELDPTRMRTAEMSDHRTPEQAFDEIWVSSLIRSAIEQTRTACNAEGLETHWVVFEERVIRPMLEGRPATAYDALVERLDLVDVAQAQNMMITIKRRFARVMRAAVASTLSGRENIEDELHALLAPGDQHG